MEYYWYIVIFVIIFLLSILGISLYFKFNVEDIKIFMKTLCQKCQNCQNCCKKKTENNIHNDYDDFYNML